MKRILSLVVVALVMAAMMLVMAMPAFAAPGKCNGKCTGQGLQDNRGQFQNDDKGDNNPIRGAANGDRNN